MKKIIALLIAISLTAIFIVSCKTQETSSENSITVMVPDWAVPSDEMLNAFKEETGIRINTRRN